MANSLGPILKLISWKLVNSRSRYLQAVKISFKVGSSPQGHSLLTAPCVETSEGHSFFCQKNFLGGDKLFFQGNKIKYVNT